MQHELQQCKQKVLHTCLGSPQRFKETCGAITHLDKTNYNFFFTKCKVQTLKVDLNK